MAKLNYQKLKQQKAARAADRAERDEAAYKRDLERAKRKAQRDPSQSYAGMRF